MSIVVTFKCELSEAGVDIGPVVLIDTDLYDNDPEVKKRPKRPGSIQVGLPRGYKPQGRTNLGWKSREEAESIAAEQGAEFKET
jgi:hypothetical protein